MRMIIPAMVLAASPALAAATVVVDTPVTGSLVQQVLGDLGQVQVLLPQGAGVHDHQMRPSDMRGLEDADLLVWTGPELTPWLDRAAAAAGEGAELRLLEVASTTVRSYGDAASHDGHGHDDHGHDAAGHTDEADGHGDHDHGEGDIDPHAWLDPDNARLWLPAIAEGLTAIDPDNGAAYARNAAAAAEAIAALDGQLQARLAPRAGTSLVVMHDAYGYFTDHYGLAPALAVSLGDATAPSAARLRALREEVAESGAVCAFPEYGVDPALLATAIEGTGVRMGEPLSPEGVEAAPDAALYAALLEGMVTTVATCLEKE